MDANTLTNLSQAQVDASKQYALDSASIAEMQQALYQQASDLTTTNSAGQTPEMVRVAGIAELEQQRRTQAIAAAMGVVPDLTSDIQMMLAKDIKDNILASRELGNQIAEKESVGFFDNPFMYLVNQMTLQDDYAKYDGHVAAVTSARENLSTLDSRISAAKTTAANIATKVTDKTIADQLQAAENEIALKKLEYQNKILGNEAGILEKSYNLSKDQYAQFQNMYNIANAEESKRLQWAHFALAQEQDRERRAAKKDAESEMAAILADIHLGEQRDLGAPVTSAQAVKMQFGKNTPEGRILQQRYEAGQRIRLKGPVVVAAGLGDRVERFTSEPIVVRTDAEKELVKAQTTAYADAMALLPKGTKPEVVEEKAKEIFDAKWKNWTGLIDVKDQTNPMAQVPIAALANMKALQGDPAWELYMTAKKDKLADTYDPNEAFRMMATAVAAGHIKLEEAVSTLNMVGSQYKIVVNENNRIEYFTGRKLEKASVKIHIGDTSRMMPGASFTTRMLGVVDAMLGTPNNMEVDHESPEKVRQALLQMIPSTLESSYRGSENPATFPRISLSKDEIK